MKTSQNGINLLKQFEGLSLTAYKNAGEEYYTIGYGHYGADVYEGMTITEEEAEQLLKSDLVIYEGYVYSIAVAKFPSINQNQYDALISYTYNRGVGKSDGSNGLRQLIYNSNTLEEVGNNFVVYWGSNTNYQEALIARRQKEAELFKTPYTESGETEPDEGSQKIESAISWAIAIANDDSHGYDQTNRWGADYDCSSFIISAWEQAGVPVKTNGATYTGNMKSVFLETGFELADLTSLERGDVLLKENKHTVMYIGDGQIVHASINEKGTTTGGVTGDQTGKEICVRSYYNYKGGWDCVLRYPHTSSGGGYVPPTNGEVWEEITKTSYNTNQLTSDEIETLKTLSFDDTVYMKFTFERSKKEVGVNYYGNKLTFDEKSYKIKSVKSNGFLVLKHGESGLEKTVNPKYIESEEIHE